MSKRIPLTQEQFTIVDDADFKWLNQWKWHYQSKGYAARSVQKNGKTRLILMHRAILGVPAGMYSDHINGDRLDNRRMNLRICTNSQNSMNRRKRSGCSSIYKGVYWEKAINKWRARIKLHGKRKDIGYFDDEQEAARAYDQAALELFGKFAQLNYPGLLGGSRASVSPQLALSETPNQSRNSCPKPLDRCTRMCYNCYREAKQ